MPRWLRSVLKKSGYREHERAVLKNGGFLPPRDFEKKPSQTADTRKCEKVNSRADKEAGKHRVDACKERGNL